MMEKINIAELLKDCPQGMELDCTTWENVTFEKVRDDNIFIRRNNKQPQHDSIVVLNEYGCATNHEDEKCRIFPKGKTTWEGFHRPFKEGDIIATKLGSVFILKDSSLVDVYSCYVALNHESIFIYKEQKFGYKDLCRLATEEEKQKLFQAIKANGYRWNPETKTLEKLPKFKVGDRIRHIVGREEFATVVSVEKLHYNLNSKVGTSSFSISLQHEWELVPDEFDITTLKPFDKVLVRDNINEKWNIHFFSYIDDAKMFKTIMGTYIQCIPYEGNEHLLGTTDTCDDYYKAWK